MSGPIQDHIRAAATRLMEQARARGNRLSLSDAEQAVRANVALRARGIPTTPAAAAAAIAAVDREVIRHLTTICKVLPRLGKDSTRLKAALEGHLLPCSIELDAMMLVQPGRLRIQPRGSQPPLTAEPNSEMQ